MRMTSNSEQRSFLSKMLIWWDSGKQRHKNRQDDALYCAGYEDKLSIAAKDKKVAELLGITVSESVLLRLADNKIIWPQDVFRNLEPMLGKHYLHWLSLAYRIDEITDWKRIAKTYAKSVSFDAHYDACARAYAAVSQNTRAYLGAAAIAGAVPIGISFAARNAALEAIGWSNLEKPYFLPMFWRNHGDLINQVVTRD